MAKTCFTYHGGKSAVEGITHRVYASTKRNRLSLSCQEDTGGNSNAAPHLSRYTKQGPPFAMQNPNHVPDPMVVLPVKYLDEVKWLPEKRMSMWRHIDRQSILTQVGGPGITGELISISVRLIEPLQEACIASYAKEMPTCADWTSALPHPLMIKIFASMSTCVMVGPKLGGLDSEWQSSSMGYLAAALSAPTQVRMRYLRWLYWLSRYANAGVKTMWKHRGRIKQGRRKYEDGVQWLYDAHTAGGKILFVMMVASIHSTSGAGLCIVFDMLDYPDALAEIKKEIDRVRATNPGNWTWKTLGELRFLDSFMRDSSRVPALTQYTAVHRIPAAPFTFKYGLEIPARTTLQLPSYHRNFDVSMHENPQVSDATRHLRKREANGNTHRFYFASTLKLMIIHLLTHYEFKHIRDKKDVPRFISNNMFVVPNPGLPSLIGEKKGP
ncbi:cytochrome P450 [Xylariaceae sp. AK1471]|nr:cytochrome P450 [Xylariaceae sp. AK1471]